ncbi:undecaprenyldiphospho-muramoylpentapeptide beta-N-acetylglucosaminyltransferase [Parabacteroides sp. FAFU027]|uniref:undecaprenyldiphospho-muramoylpentapeptide beta-N-acetylglucosaminyltransferase n=1 Tax=Parabacteroides sp. FAFU027 TaxID=2922715 RepID=UPI001FAEFE51|nr:undecaprenyldiphospho-muramoylpentapeptide beta-N-acetylglucosaminyltransferase [Parabacteroides sp. FAFU027]
MKKNPRIIISGGGTGGHIFPAISIANAIKVLRPEAEFLFIGAENRMEMEKVPAAGYKIVGLPVSGFDRKNLLKNVVVLYRLGKSMVKAISTVRQFKPDAAVGVGGYASGPTLRAAGMLGIPTVIQEQNSYAGVTNKLLAKNAAKICVAYDKMERFFPKDKIILTGNPVRQDLFTGSDKREVAYSYFNLNPNKKTILVVGGSLGARTVNQSMIAGLAEIGNSDVQFIWQTGKYYYEDAKAELEKQDKGNIHLTAFVSRMDLAYAVADVIISRAGASSISEFCLLGKPVILVPSPNVAEDHQTKNAMALVEKEAAIMIRDAEAKEKLVPAALQLINDEVKIEQLGKNILTLAQHDSARRIAEEVLKLID